MRGRNVLLINTATVLEALDSYMEDFLNTEGVSIDSVEQIEDEDGLWFRLILLEPGTDE